MKETERREAPRSKVGLVLEVLEPEGFLLTGVGRLLDISLKGGRVETSLLLGPHQRLRAKIRLDSHTFLELPCRVAWKRKKQTHTIYGFEFIDVAKPTLLQLRNYILSRSDTTR